LRNLRKFDTAISIYRYAYIANIITNIISEYEDACGKNNEKNAKKINLFVL